MDTRFADAQIALMGPFPPRPGGVSVQCELLAEALVQAGAGVTRINSDVPRLRRRGLAGRLALPPVQVLALLWRLWRTRQRWQVLHVHVASWWGFMPAVVGLLARLRSKRLVLTFHGGEAARFMTRWGWLAKPVLRRYDSLLALTPTQARVFAGHGLVPQIAPNLLPIERFQGAGRGPVSPRLLWLRQLEPRYRPADALEVLARVQAHYPGATLTLAGQGPLASALRRQVAERRLAGVQFPGHLAAEAIPAAYASAGIFLNTSAIDNQPLTLLEASASGLPVVSTAAGAIPDLINDGENGLLAPVGDVEALAAQVLRLLAAPDLAARLSDAARANAARYTWPHIAPLLARAYGLVGDTGSSTSRRS